MHTKRVRPAAFTKTSRGGVSDTEIGVFGFTTKRASAGSARSPDAGHDAGGPVRGTTSTRNGPASKHLAVHARQPALQSHLHVRRRDRRARVISANWCEATACRSSNDHPVAAASPEAGREQMPCRVQRVTCAVGACGVVRLFYLRQRQFVGWVCPRRLSGAVSIAESAIARPSHITTMTPTVNRIAVNVDIVGPPQKSKVL